MEHPDTWHFCSFCPYKCKVGFALLRHVNRKHTMRYNVEPFYCTNEPQEFKCIICESCFDHKLSLRAHSKQVHIDSVVRDEGPDTAGTTERSSLFDNFGAYQCGHCKGFTNSLLSYETLLYCCERKGKWRYKPGSLNFRKTSLAPTDFLKHRNIEPSQKGENAKPYKGQHKAGLAKHNVHGHTCQGTSKWFHCEQCSYKIKVNGNLEQHVSTIPADQTATNLFLCQYCSYKCTDKRVIQRHVFSNHTIDESIGWFQCEHCSFRGKQKEFLMRHILLKHANKTHEKPKAQPKVYRCAQCAYKTKKKELLRRHILYRHTSKDAIEWFKCELCSHTSKQKGQLKIHVLRKHTSGDAVKWIRCEFCSYKCKMKHNLKSHLFNKHTEGEKIPWLQCGHCPHKCKTKSQLQTHILYKHTDERAIEMFQCGQCSHKCVRKWNLNQHILHKHTNKQKS